MICKICGKELDPMLVQQGGCHFKCFNEEIEVYKISQKCYPEGSSFIEKGIEKVVAAIESTEPDEDDGLCIEKITMLHGEFVNLPEFEGF